MKKEKTPAKTKFLLCPSNETNELYILHREYPACLIWINPGTPSIFIIREVYEQVDPAIEISQLPFIQEAKDFFDRFIEKNAQDSN